MDVWNVLVLLQTAFSDHEDEEAEEFMLELLWVSHYRRARDEAPSTVGIWRTIKSSILEKSFFHCMDTIEAVLERLNAVDRAWVPNWEHVIVEAINARFERNLVGYRLNGGQLVPFDRQEEMAAVADALDAAGPGSSAAHEHLRQSLALLASRESPDYRNSIKEAISAVESVARSITGASTLGTAIKALPGAGMPMHRALLSAWSSMYGWTSDAGGLRHGNEEISHADQALAKYVLVTCSAFVTLLLDESRKGEAQKA
jgi:hypothetical protein